MKPTNIAASRSLTPCHRKGVCCRKRLSLNSFVNQVLSSASLQRREHPLLPLAHVAASPSLIPDAKCFFGLWVSCPALQWPADLL